MEQITRLKGTISVILGCSNLPHMPDRSSITRTIQQEGFRAM